MDTRYSIYLLSDEWRNRRTGCILKADSKCEGCFSEHDLQAHHLTYARIFSEPLTDLMALCRKCHERIESFIRAGVITRQDDSGLLRKLTIKLLNGGMIPKRHSKKAKKYWKPKGRKTKSGKKAMAEWRKDRQNKWLQARRGGIRTRPDRPNYGSPDTRPAIHY